MAFTWLNKQGVQSDQGYVVQVVDRFCVEYREANRVLSVEVEDGIKDGRYCLIVSPGCFSRWDEMQLHESLDGDEQARIERNFREAMEFQGLAVVVEGPD